MNDRLMQEAQRLKAARLGKEDQATTWAREAVERAAPKLDQREIQESRGRYSYDATVAGGGGTGGQGFTIRIGNGNP